METEKRRISIEDWSKLDLLRNGNRLQHSAHIIIESLGLRNLLRGFNPQLIGDIALGIDSSDTSLKIILSTFDLMGLEKLCREKLWQRAGLKIERKPINGAMSVLVRFGYNQFSVTISAQMTPILSQRAFKIFRAQQKTLNLMEPVVLCEIEQLKASGLTTEMALCQYLGLPGEARPELLMLDTYTEIELREKIKTRTHFSQNLNLNQDPIYGAPIEVSEIGHSKIEMEKLANSKSKRMQL